MTNNNKSVHNKSVEQFPLPREMLKQHLLSETDRATLLEYIHRLQNVINAKHRMAKTEKPIVIPGACSTLWSQGSVKRRVFLSNVKVESVSHFGDRPIGLWCFEVDCTCDVTAFPAGSICEHLQEAVVQEIDLILLGALAATRPSIVHIPVIQDKNTVVGAFVAFIKKDNKVRAILICNGDGTPLTIDEMYPALCVPIGDLFQEELSTLQLAPMILATCRYIIDMSNTRWNCKFCGTGLPDTAARNKIAALDQNNAVFLNRCAVILSGVCLSCIRDMRDGNVTSDDFSPVLT